MTEQAVWGVGSAGKPRAPTQEPAHRICLRPQLFSEFSPTMSCARKKIMMIIIIIIIITVPITGIWVFVPFIPRLIPWHFLWLDASLRVPGAMPR